MSLSDPIPFTQYDIESTGGFDYGDDGEGGETQPDTNEEEQDLLAAAAGQTRQSKKG